MRVASAVVVSAALLATGVGCSPRHSGSPTAAASLPATVGNRPLTAEDIRVDDSAVANGLSQLKTIVNEMADSVGTDPAAAKDAQGRIEPIWSSIEGTVRTNEPDTYRRFEAEFAVIQRSLSPADPVKARAAADAVVKAADGYLARHSDGSTQPAPDEPSPPAAPSPSAASSG